MYMNKNDTDGHAKLGWGKVHETSVLDKELKATEENW